MPANSSINDCYNIDDLRELAKRRIPAALFDYIEGYAEDGVTCKNNRKAFDSYKLIPRILVDVNKVSLKTKLFNNEIASPLVLAPTALSRLFHYKGEHAVANAAAKAGLIYTLSTLSSVSIEEIAQANGPRWFQIYCYKDREITRNMIRRAKAAGYSAVCLTVDANIGGNREQDLRNGLTIPPKLNLTTILNSLKHPTWLWQIATSAPITAANVHKEGSGIKQAISLLQYASEQLDPSLTWKDIAWIRDEWDGTLIIKGILSIDDARQAVDFGADGIVLSNHGGRQLDHTPATIDILPEFVTVVGDKCDIIIDGGIRRGTDIIKAIALGAKACMIGRPYLYGLAADGQSGAGKAIDLLQSEIYKSMQLLGCQSIQDLDASYVQRTLGEL